MSEKAETTSVAQTTEKKKSNHVGGFWLKTGQKDGKSYSFLSGNIEIEGRKHYFTINKSKIPKEELGNRPQYVVYADNYVPKNKPVEQVEAEEPF